MMTAIENLIDDYKNDLLTESAFAEKVEDIINETSSLNTLTLIRELILETGLLGSRVTEDLHEAIFDKVAPLIADLIK